jgi:predicted acylesterase/phospholipase RssA
MTNIKHLVIAGGAHLGFSYFGALKTLCQNNFFHMNQIESVYSTSIGAVLTTFLTLDMNWTSLEEYLVNLQWKRIFPTNIRNSLMAIPKGGLFDVSTIEKIFEPVLLDRNLTLDITLEEFYQYNKKELHFITTLYEPLVLKDISYKTHPEWRLIDAIYASCCLPVLFVPYTCNQNETYIDGAMYSNYPVNQCIENGGKKDEILGVCFQHHQTQETVHKNSSLRLIYFVLDLIMKLWRIVKEENGKEPEIIANEVKIVGDTRIYEGFQVLSSITKRRELIDRGMKASQSFLDSKDYFQRI